VLSRTKAIATELRTAAESGATSVDVTSSVHQLRSAIQALEREVSSQPGGGPSATVQALKHIDLRFESWIAHWGFAGILCSGGMGVKGWGHTTDPS
jgi:hypothetical protein